MPERTTEAQRVVDGINRTHGTRFRLEARPAGGVNEVWLLDEPGGGRAVLKTDAGTLDHLRAAARVVEDLRARRYPTPRWLFTGRIDDGTTYHVQELVHGDFHWGNVLVHLIARADPCDDSCLSASRRRSRTGTRESPVNSHRCGDAVLGEEV